MESAEIIVQAGGAAPFLVGIVIGLAVEWKFAPFAKAKALIDSWRGR